MTQDQRRLVKLVADVVVIIVIVAFACLAFGCSKPKAFSSLVPGDLNYSSCPEGFHVECNATFGCACWPAKGPQKLTMSVRRAKYKSALDDSDDPKDGKFIVFVVRIEGDLSSPEWACPKTTWLWGDGGKSEYEATCAPGDKSPAVFSGGYRYQAFTHDDYVDPKFVIQYPNGKRFEVESHIPFRTLE